MRNATARVLSEAEQGLPPRRRAGENRGEEPRGDAPRGLRLVQASETGRAARETEYAPTYAANGRRTVKITGQPVPARRRRSATATQIEARPDRIALWAVLLGLLLVFMAVATANASAV